MKKYYKEKGSVLAYSLIILAMLFAIAGSMSSVSVMEKKSSGSAQYSAQAYQIADSGVQIGINKINAILDEEENTLEKAFVDSVTTLTQCAVIGGKAIVGLAMPDNPEMTYELSFLTSTGTYITSCSSSVRNVKEIKSTGAYKNTVRAVTVGVRGIDEDTKLLIHADGANGATSFTDASNIGRTVSGFGNVNVSTSNPKIGTGSALFDGSGDYLSVGNSSDWNFGTGDFTIDFWEKSSAVTANMYALALGISTTNLKFLFNSSSTCGGSTRGIWIFWNSSGANRICVGTSGEYIDGEWHHIALVRKSDTMSLYIDGALKGTASVAGVTIDLTTAGSNFYIGTNTAAGGFWNGNLDEIRISKGIARWDGPFTPNTLPY